MFLTCHAAHLPAGLPLQGLRPATPMKTPSVGLLIGACAGLCNASAGCAGPLRSLAADQARLILVAGPWQQPPSLEGLSRCLEALLPAAGKGHGLGAQPGRSLPAVCQHPRLCSAAWAGSLSATGGCAAQQARRGRAAVVRAALTGLLERSLRSGLCRLRPNAAVAAPQTVDARWLTLAADAATARGRVWLRLAVDAATARCAVWLASDSNAQASAQIPIGTSMASGGVCPAAALINNHTVAQRGCAALSVCACGLLHHRCGPSSSAATRLGVCTSGQAAVNCFAASARLLPLVVPLGVQVWPPAAVSLIGHATRQPQRGAAEQPPAGSDGSQRLSCGAAVAQSRANCAHGSAALNQRCACQPLVHPATFLRAMRWCQCRGLQRELGVSPGLICWEDHLGCAEGARTITTSAALPGQRPRQ